MAQQYLTKFFDTIFAKISESTYFSALLQEAENKTGIPGPYIVTAITTLILLFVVLGYGPYVLCDVVVVFYPAYKSFKALETEDELRCMFWIKYWIVFGMFHAAEHIGDSLFWWFPGYPILKFLFLVWCFAPIENNGTLIIYDNYIRPTFQRNAETVDDVIKTVRRFSVYPTTDATVE